MVSIISCSFGVQYLRTALSIASRRLVPAGREQAAMLFSCLEKAAVAFFHSISWISMASGFCVGTSKNGTMDFKICVFLVWIRSSYVMDLFSSMDNTSYIIFLLFYERMPVCMNTIKEKGKNRCMRD